MIYLELFWGFLKVGCFAFGGAYAAIPLIRDVVLSYGWLDDEMLSYMIAVSESTPGPIMVNLATYVGSSQAGFAGALLATSAVVLPSFVLILLIMVVLKSVLKNRYVQAALSGLKPCVIGIILATGVYMMIRNCAGAASSLAAKGAGAASALTAKGAEAASSLTAKGAEAASSLTAKGAEAASSLTAKGAGAASAVTGGAAQAAAGALDWKRLAVTVVLLLVLYGSRKIRKKKLSPILFILISAALGLLVF